MRKIDVGGGRLAVIAVVAAGMILAGCSDSNSHPATPTASPAGATATPTVALVTLAGSCVLPGDGPHGLAPCADGTATTLFRCDDRAGCLHEQGLSKLATTTVGGTAAASGSLQASLAAGRWSVQIPAADARSTLIAQAEVADGVTYRAFVFCTETGTCAPDTVISPVSEATVELLDSYGFENYPDDRVELVERAVEQATANLSFTDSTPEAAPEVAVSTASADPDVTELLVIPSINTPTPTAVPNCCDCGGGCFLDSGSGCGACTAVADAACVDSGCATFTPTATPTATGTATATATATAPPTATPTASLTATFTQTQTATVTRTITRTPTRTPTVTATGTVTATPTVTATRTQTSTPTTALACLPSTCEATTDCECKTHTSLFAIAHSYNDPETTVLYRVTVAAWSTGTNWGDGTNGFFYEATAGGNTPSTYTYVPFNGMAVGSDGTPSLPQFDFIVPVDVSAGVNVTTLKITACASDEAGTLVTNDCGAQEYTPTCTKKLWSESYSTLTLPTVGSPPSALSEASLEFSGTNTVSIQNTGVYPGVLTFTPQTTLSTGDENWLYNHLVFFDTNGNPYTNDILDDCSHPSIGVLSIDEAAYAVPGQASYRTKYGNTNELTSATSPAKQFFFYTWDRQQTTAIDVGAEYIYDASSSCPGWINGGPGSIASTCNELTAAAQVTASSSLPNISPYAQVVPESTQGVFTTSPSAEAGAQEIRDVTILGEQGVSLCEYAMNPLAIYASGTAYNPPDYAIDDSAGDWDPFPQGLTYTVPTGFGNCTSAAPLCESTTDYSAYVPHYADSDGNFGTTLNGGSTTQPLIGSFSLADEYALGTAGSSTTNTLQWFDNCGYGHTYEESADTSPKLGSRMELPSAPNSGKTYTYSITNDLSYPIAFGKDCCASWYQENTDVSPTAWEPPVQIDLSYAGFIAPGQTLTYQTLFSDESMRIYNAATGTALFKLRLNPSSGALFGCSASDWSASISGSGPYTVEIAAAGVESLSCGSVGACPFGLTPASDSDGLYHCRTTSSAFVFGMEEWSSAVSALTNSVQVRAWGGVGRAQEKSGGTGGFALTTQAPDDLNEDLYVYVGRSNGSSTVATTTELSDLTSSAAVGVSDPATVDVLLIAGGGGGAASNSLGSGSGGAGGVAIANADPSGSAVSVAGSAGNSGGGQSGGSGGNGNGLGEGGDVAGAAGVGGYSGGTMWDDSGSLIPPQSWSAGSGPDGANLSYGQAGGGFGSGGHGHSNSGGAGGGGGGGSWAAGNTAYDSSAPSAAPSSPADSDGAFELAFSLDGVPGSCVVDSSAGTVTCTLSQTSSSVDLTTLVSVAAFVAPSTWTIDAATPMWIRGWGGAGGNGQSEGGGSGGAQGTAQTLTSVNDLKSRFGTTTLYYYAGQLGDENHPAGKGGSSTIVATQDLSSVSPCLSSGSCTQNIVLIAGGGGGGAWPSGNGGDGGSAVATTGGDTSGPGDASGDAGGGSGGTGGSKGGAGDGGSSGSSGPGGMGGPVHISNGATTSVGWLSSTQPSAVGSSGEGGEGRHDSNSTYVGGGGGGGWGGGGGGGAGGQTAQGGGGGGSYAIKATQGGSVPSESGSGSDGALEIGFLVTAQ